MELESCREDGKWGGKWYFGGSFGTNLRPLFIWSQKNSFHWYRILSLLLESRQIKISAYENGFQSCRGAIDLQEQDSM